MLEDMEQPSSVSDNKSRLGGAPLSGSGGPDGDKNSMHVIRSIVQNESDSESVRKAGAEINIISLTGRKTKRIKSSEESNSNHFDNDGM